MAQYRLISSEESLPAEAQRRRAELCPKMRRPQAEATTDVNIKSWPFATTIALALQHRFRLLFRCIACAVTESKPHRTPQCEEHSKNA
jgi:hypothetical protein